MKRSSVCIAVGLFVVGCAGQAARPPVTEVTRIPERGGWFCQLSPSGEGWDCVQDPQLAEDPVPQRLPKPRPSAPADEALPPEAQTEAAPDPGRPDGAPEPVAEPSPSEPPPLEPPPPEPESLMQVSRDFYAVQLMAMTSREDLDHFVTRNGLEDLQAARVERDGRLYHVLLLGVYPSLEDARSAMADLPAGLAGVEPWIRPVGSLQSAMGRADALATSDGI